MVIFGAELGAELVAVLFLIVLLASAIVLRALTSKAAHGVPGIGAVLGAAVDNFWASLFVALAPPANAALGVWTSSIDWLTAQWGSLTGTIVNLGELTFAAVHKIVTLAIPHATALVLAQATKLVTAARAYSLGLVQGAEHVAAQGIAKAEALSHALYLQGQAFARSLFLLAEHDIKLSFAAANIVAVDLAAQERAFTLQQAAALNAHADELFRQATALIAAAELQFGGQLGRVAGADAERLRIATKELQTEIDAARAAVGALAAGSVAALAVDVAAIKALRCIKFCDSLGAIGEFSSLLDVGLVFALVAAARSDPRGVQDFISGTVAPAVKGLVAEAEALL